MLIKISDLPSEQVIPILKVAKKIDAFMSAVSVLLERHDDLSSEQVDTLRSQVSGRFADIELHSRSSTQVHIKRVASQCAMLIGKPDVSMDLRYEAFMLGDGEALLDCLEYYSGMKEVNRAKHFFAYAYDELTSRQFIISTNVDNQEQFLRNLAIYAFGLGFTKEAHELVAKIAGPIKEDDPRILKYKTQIDTPLDAEMAIGEAISFFQDGDTDILHMPLLESTEEYLNQQIDHLRSSSTIEDDMLAYLTSDSGPDDYDFTKPEGKNFYALRIYYQLALFFRDHQRMSFIIDQLKIGDVGFVELFSDVVEMGGLYSPEYQSREEVIHQGIFYGFLYPALDMFSGPEYFSLHQEIYALMRRFGPKYSAEEYIKIHKERIQGQISSMNVFGVSDVYIAIMEAVVSHHGPIMAMHIMRSAEEETDIERAKSIHMLLAYILYYRITNGKLPDFEEGVIQDFKNISLQDPQLSVLIKKICLI